MNEGLFTAYQSLPAWKRLLERIRKGGCTALYEIAEGEAGRSWRPRFRMPRDGRCCWFRHGADRSAAGAGCGTADRRGLRGAAGA